MRKSYLLLSLSIFLFSCASTKTNQINTPIELTKIDYVDLSKKDQKGIVKQYWTVEKRDNPKYPISAARKNISGCVAFVVGINKQGKSQDFKIISSYPKNIFDYNAAAVLKNWRWKATEKNSDHKPVLTYLRLDFTIDKGSSDPGYLKNCP